MLPEVLIEEAKFFRYKDGWGFSKSRTGSAQSNRSRMGAPGTMKRTQSNSPARNVSCDFGVNVLEAGAGPLLLLYYFYCFVQ
jgi:hypothetical protein